MVNIHTIVQKFIDDKQAKITTEYDDNGVHSTLMKHAYMVGVLESTLANVLYFINQRYGDEATIQAMERALIIEESNDNAN